MYAFCWDNELYRCFIMTDTGTILRKNSYLCRDLIIMLL